jgi:hypothetical protein
MRAYVVVGSGVVVILAAQAGTLRGDSGKEAGADKIARLVQQLGDGAFAKREAASKELTAIGAPALAALRKAAVSSKDPEVRPRAKRIIRTIATRAADAAIKRELASLKGKWNVEFSNGVKEVCQLRNDRTASVAEPLRTSNGRVEVKGGSVVIVYQDDRVERWTPVGKRMVVEHWYPGARFPSGTPVLGIADGAR